jgi:lipopolysaccharide transport system permease protein
MDNVQGQYMESEGVNPSIPLEKQTMNLPNPTIRIKPSKGWSWLQLVELWEYRELLFFFVWRDLKVRYKQTFLGVTWAIIQPFLAMVIFSLFFGRLAKMDSDGFPYPIFSYAALVPWTFFSNAITQASNSLIVNANMVKKIYFPRLTMPIATVLAGLVDFALAFIVLLGMMFFYDFYPTIRTLWILLFLFLALLTSLGVGFWLSALNVQFRDVRYTVPFLVQAWLFATPVAYSSSLLSEPWRTLYGLNPMVGVIEGFRWALLGTDISPGPVVLLSSVVGLVLLMSGAIYFRKMEKSFADIV